MAIETVAQTAQASFADPQNGTSPIDADEVTANDNALRVKHNTHDADDTIHVQGSTLAARPAAGTAGRKWVTRDAGSLRFFRDTGSAWEELSYIGTGSDATITGTFTFSTAPVFSNNQTFAADVSVGDDLAVTDDATIGGDLTVTGALDVDGATTLDAVLVAETLGVTGNVTMAGTLGVTGAVTGASFAGSGASLTSLPAAELSGTLPAISGANLTALNATNIASGTLANARLNTALGGRTFSSVQSETLTVGGVATNGTVVLGAASVTPTDALSVSQYHAESGSNTGDTTSDCPVATQSETLWLKVTIGAKVGWIPVVIE